MTTIPIMRLAGKADTVFDTEKVKNPAITTVRLQKPMMTTDKNGTLLSLTGGAE
jgi:hypothetical protein